MKKIIALVVAIVMMASMSVVAFAAASVTRNPAQIASEEVTRVQSDATDGEVVGNGTLLVYTVSQGYVVTIPEDTDFDTNLKATGSVALSEVKLPLNKQVQVQIDSANNWVLKDTGLVSSDVAYGAYTTNVTAYTTTGKLADGTVVVSANMVQNVDSAKPLDGAANSTALYFATAGTSQVGIYTDTLTFTSFVLDYTTQNEVPDAE